MKKSLTLSLIAISVAAVAGPAFGDVSDAEFNAI